MKKEFGMNDENEKLFDFEQGGSTPRVLIGLKNGALLARNVPETEVLAMGLKTPWLSPSLQIWKTALSTKLLITGSVGVNPLFVEKKSNFPRFKVMVKQDMSEQDILDTLLQQISELERILNKKFNLPTGVPKVLNLREPTNSRKAKVSESAGKTGPPPPDTSAVRTRFCSCRMKF